MSKTPKLRFKEFSGDWQSEKLGNLTVKTGIKNKYNEDYEVYSISNKYGFIPQDEQFENSRLSGLDKSLYQIVGKGEFAYNPARINVGSIGVLEEDKKVIVSSLYVCFRFLEQMNYRFFKTYLGTYKFNKDVISNTEGSVREYLFYENFSRIKINKPKLAEQEKIASFFSLIDDKISLQGEKVEALKDYKKGMMQKIFSRELRFKDDDGRDYPEWEGKKLDDIVKFLRGKELSKSDISQVGNIPCILYGELFTQYDAVIDKIKSRCISEKGTLSKKFDILMPTSDVTPEGLATASCIMMDNVYLGGDINILRPKNNINGIFLSYQINHFKNYIINRVSGTTVKHIYLKDIKDIKYLIPCESEQRKISGLLVKIDIKIKLEQEKLDYLNEYKKGLLQQMFV